MSTPAPEMVAIVRAACRCGDPKVCRYPKCIYHAHRIEEDCEETERVAIATIRTLLTMEPSGAFMAREIERRFPEGSVPQFSITAKRDIVREDFNATQAARLKEILGDEG